ncbi:MAG: ABC transporter permease [Clostridiales bacterium]|nr:ABC transporter permease [Clostridiales bacterium]
MNQFLKVLKFELTNYFKNKSWIITTVVICLLSIVGLSIPTLIDFDNIFGSHESNDEKIVYALVDKNNIIEDKDILTSVFENSEWKIVNNTEDIKNLINNEEEKVEAGFVINSPTDYSYYVANSSFTDNNEEKFSSILSTIYRTNYLESKNLNAAEIESIYNTPINSNVEILGKDSVSNYFYSYVLIFIIYMLIIMYGQLIAVSVTTEKSNRSIEVLVTSTSTNSLIFGKVIAGAIASIVQVGAIIGSALITYKLSSSSWEGALDRFLNIPAEVLITFAVFGILGFLLYSFIFGALGALVSKTEDISKSAGPLTFIFVIAFVLTFAGMYNVDGIMMKVLSYVPFSSCIAMFVRVAMGTVSYFEIIISAIISILTTGIVGVLAAKIYRLGTLRYGNPIKLSNAIKLIKKEK